MAEIDAAVVEALRDVYDPCCAEKGISVVDMGLIRSATVRDGAARVDLLLTTGWCPFAARVVADIRTRLGDLPDVREAEVTVSWDEAWTTDRLSSKARAVLQFLPDPATAGDRDAYVAAHTRPPGKGEQP
jgi:metal-sulfur cluster biosynthetic enzyme